MLEGLRQRDFIRSAFGRYVSPEVARELLESPEGLRFGGEKRVITVLMSDLRGYTRFAEQGDPAVVMDVLNAYLARMTDIVIQHGGTINEFIGDAVFAVFGAPLAHEDHAERAAACALAMQQAMAELNRAHDDKAPAAIRDGDRRQHRRGRRRQHRLRAAGEVRDRGQRGEHRGPRRGRHRRRPGIRDGGDMGR